MTTPRMAIELAGIEKRGRRKPIGPVHLQIPAGYIVALVGPNGSGKSTLLQMMIRMLMQDTGELKWFGETVAGVLPLHVQRQMAYVPEVSAIEENYVTAEQAAIFRSYWYPEWNQGKFEELMDRLDVPRHERLSKMSKGERRKYEIAAALSTGAKLLILDEPSSGLDPFAWKSMIEELQTFMEQEEATIIIATHIIEEVNRLADYIALVHQGQILGMVEKDTLFGSWKEIWIRGELPWNELSSEVISYQEDGSGIYRLIARQGDLLEKECDEAGIKIMKNRSLELEEVLELWIKGYNPDYTIEGREGA